MRNILSFFSDTYISSWYLWACVNFPAGDFYTWSVHGDLFFPFIFYFFLQRAQKRRLCTHAPTFKKYPLLHGDEGCSYAMYLVDCKPPMLVRMSLLSCQTNR